VISLDSTFRYYLENLSEAEKQAYRSYVSPATYSIEEFKDAVMYHLQRRFGTSAVSIGSKAIRISGDQNRRDADVIVCYEYKNFRSFTPYRPDDFVPGIIFPTPSGEIINYPKLHSANLTAQHQVTAGWLKPMVRIFKNMRNRLVENGEIADDTACSYYVEGMLYSVPSDKFGINYAETFRNCFNWLWDTDRSKLVCANRQYWLLGNTNVQWTAAKCDLFLNALLRLWNNWG
jgi:hypothetical protein